MGEDKEWERGEPDAAVMSLKIPKEWVIKWLDYIYRGETLEEGKPNPWAGEFKVEGGVFQSYPLTNRNWGRTWKIGMF